MQKTRFIRFDWAAKYMLRSKADYVIFEGLISVLVGEQVKIEALLESESNKQSRDDKFNRVDIKARNSKGEIILVEIQQTREADYLQRMLYGVAKAVTEHIGSGQGYEHVKKVYSINILYFDLGEGADYLYHGQTSLRGVHVDDTLQLTAYERDDLHGLARAQRNLRHAAQERVVRVLLLHAAPEEEEHRVHAREHHREHEHHAHEQPHRRERTSARAVGRWCGKIQRN